MLILYRNGRLLMCSNDKSRCTFSQAILSLEEFQSLAGEDKKSFAFVRHPPPPCQVSFRLSSYEISIFLVFFFFLSRGQQNWRLNLRLSLGEQQSEEIFRLLTLLSPFAGEVVLINLMIMRRTMMTIAIAIVSCPTRLSSSWWWRPQNAPFEKCSI